MNLQESKVFTRLHCINKWNNSMMVITQYSILKMPAVIFLSKIHSIIYNIALRIYENNRKQLILVLLTIFSFWKVIDKSITTIINDYKLPQGKNTNEIQIPTTKYTNMTLTLGFYTIFLIQEEQIYKDIFMANRRK